MQRRFDRNALLLVAACLAMLPALLWAQAKLPEGHPDISHLMNDQAAQLPATTQPATLGTLTIQAVQSTAGAAAVSDGGEATIDLYTGQHLLKTYNVKLDAAGRATLENIPVSLGIDPIVKVIYRDVEYAAEGQFMDSTHPAQQLNVPVYETTTDAPAWQVSMRHLMVEPAAAAEGQLQVIDVLQIENPSDRAWTGAVMAEGGGGGKGTTFVLPLPDGAANVQLIEGFHDCCTTIDAAGVHNQMPLLPGTKIYRLAYTLPVQSGRTQISVASPAPVQHLMVFVPNDGSQVQAEGLSAVESSMGDGSKRFFAATDVQADQSVSLALSGVATTSVAAGSQPAAPAGLSATSLAKAIAGAGSVLILLLGGAFMFLKGPKAKTS